MRYTKDAVAERVTVIGESSDNATDCAGRHPGDHEGATPMKGRSIRNTVARSTVQGIPALSVRSPTHEPPTSR